MSAVTPKPSHVTPASGSLNTRVRVLGNTNHPAATAIAQLLQHQNRDQSAVSTTAADRALLDHLAPVLLHAAKKYRDHSIAWIGLGDTPEGRSTDELLAFLQSHCAAGFAVECEKPETGSRHIHLIGVCTDLSALRVGAAQLGLHHSAVDIDDDVTGWPEFVADPQDSSALRRSLWNMSRYALALDEHRRKRRPNARRGPEVPVSCHGWGAEGFEVAASVCDAFCDAPSRHRHCGHCGKPLPGHVRSDCEYCPGKSACRMAAMRKRGPPSAEKQEKARPRNLRNAPPSTVTNAEHSAISLF